MSRPRLIGNCLIGEQTMIDPTAIIGYPSKASQLTNRSFEESTGATIGAGCILRSNAVIYEDVVIGDDVQMAHNVVVREGVRIGDGCVFGNNAAVLDHAQLGRNVRVMELALVCEAAVIGNDVFIGPHATMTRGRHILGALEAAGRVSQEKADAMETEFADPAGPSVIVEDDVRIGAGSVLLAGVRVGKGAVIAAGAIVSMDVPENHMAVGNPARVFPHKPPPID